ncbi:hypothetical protein GCM10025857_20130 [Alicyclobacillus contaminans]|uniref:hypothetical protein n=1 Tax=Alicyclobacillus contaminans TaxID=392016 RepID=UPI000426841E|nr:hypothetical protein [Alicyclobacillus contaminans]GMA50656.1 hypothetical protein GCM10025857_20130 [Alicyclobacillus contaminans]
MQGQTQSSGATQAAQPLMQTPPHVITAKDLSYLKDAMSWELIAMKKCAHYAQECSDPDVRACLDRIGRLHQRHYNLLLQQCQPTAVNQQPQTAAMQ